MALCDSHSGSHWLSLPLSGILWPSLAHYCSVISCIQSLIGSQGPCSALSAAATLTHFLPLCLGSILLVYGFYLCWCRSPSLLNPLVACLEEYILITVCFSCWLSLLCAAGQSYNIVSDYIRIMCPFLE